MSAERGRQYAVGGLTIILVGLHCAMAAGVIRCGPMSMTISYLEALGALGLLVGVGGAMRVRSLCRRVERAVTDLSVVEPPPALRQLARTAGVHRLVCVAGQEVSAFCVGFFRPRIFVSSAMADLPAGQQEAILRHEVAHCRRRDPLRRVLLASAADVLFFLPLVRWVSGRHIERAELAADRAAIAAVGRREVADALMATASSGPLPMAAFGRPAMTFGNEGAGDPTEARVAQLLGDDIPVRRANPATVFLSIALFMLAVSLLSCVSTDFLNLLTGRAH